MLVQTLFALPALKISFINHIPSQTASQIHDYTGSFGNKLQYLMLISSNHRA